MGPRHPTDPDLRPWACRAACVRRRWPDRDVAKRRDVPRAADHGDALEAVADRSADGLAHVRLASLLADRRGRGAAPDRSHRLGDGGERRRAVAAVLDDVLPPPLRIGIAGGTRPARRMGRPAGRTGGVEQAVVVGVAGEDVGQREVDRPQRRAVLDGPAERAPLRAELGEREERRGRGSSSTHPSSATGGCSSGWPTQRAPVAQSAGSSTSTASGRQASSAASTERADPGPWWRMPNRLDAHR